MKSKTNNMFRFGFLAVAGVVSMYSCTDTWNDHYDAQPTLTGSGSTLEMIEKNAPEFYNVIKATGFDTNLSDGSVYTIWAPKTIDAATAAQIKELMDNEEDSLVIQQYIKNHVARYAHPLGNTPDSSIIMLNSKLASMGTLADPKFKDTNILVGESKSCENGMVYFIDGVVPYVPNLYESMEASQRKAEGMSMYKYLSQFNQDSLIVNESIAGGFNDKGEREYIDAVYRRNNTELNRIGGQIYAEDSSFTFILPSAEAYNKRYEIARRHLNFNPVENPDGDTKLTDSLTQYFAGKFAMQDLIFSNKVNKAPNDSLVSVNYSRRNWEEHVYKNPKGADGILAGAEGVACSNGTIYPVADYPMPITKQFFLPIKLTPSRANIESSKDENGNDTDWSAKNANDNPSTVNFQHPNANIVMVEDGDSASFRFAPTDGPKYATESFLFCSPSSIKNPEYSFRIPNTLSAYADEYVIKVVLVPNWVTTLPPGVSSMEDFKTLAANIKCGVRFKADLYYTDYDSIKGEKDVKKVELVADADHAVEKYAASKTLGENNEVLFRDTVSFTVPADAETPFKYSYYNRPDAGVYLKLTANATNAMVTKKQYTRQMLISKIIFDPKPREE